jgi:hypothetical protein
MGETGEHQFHGFRRGRCVNQTSLAQLTLPDKLPPHVQQTMSNEEKKLQNRR